jgi:hypothetical protein
MGFIIFMWQFFVLIEGFDKVHESPMAFDASAHENFIAGGKYPDLQA